MPSDEPRTRPATSEYREGWERTFGRIVPKGFKDCLPKADEHIKHNPAGRFLERADGRDVGQKP